MPQPGSLSGDVVDLAECLASARLVEVNMPINGEPLSAQALQCLHVALHEDVAAMEEDPEHNPFELRELKKRKLFVKDQIEAARRRYAGTPAPEAVVSDEPATDDGKRERSVDCSAHVAELQKKHAALDKRIGELQQSRGYDQCALTALKRQKLALKERITSLGGSTS